MLTIFTVPKPFKDHINIIQRNALLSWKKLLPKCEIILIGDDEGARETAEEMEFLHIPGIKKNKLGTPLLDDIFEKAGQRAKNGLMAYVNADIILMSDFLKAIEQINLAKFLMVGARWDVDIAEPINFEEDMWSEELRKSVKKNGILHGATGIDYFVFSKGMWKNIPPFAIGRTVWDNWLLFESWISNAPIIDAGGVVTVIHQNHSYGHHQKGKRGVWKGEEAEENLKLAGGFGHAFTLRDADFVLTPFGIKKSGFSVYGFLSYPFRYFEKVSFFAKIFLFPGWLAMILWRKLRLAMV